MEKIKIVNWRELLPMMQGRWFEYDKIYHLVKKYKIHNEKLEIKTNIADIYYYFDEVGIRLYDWKPIAHEGVEALELLKFAVFEGQETTALTIASKMKIENLNVLFIEEVMRMKLAHGHTNALIEGKMKSMIEKLDSTKSGPTLARDANTLSQLTKDLIGIQLNDIKTMAMIQKAIESESKKNEKNNSNEKD